MPEDPENEFEIPPPARALVVDVASKPPAKPTPPAKATLPAQADNVLKPKLAPKLDEFPTDFAEAIELLQKLDNDPSRHLGSRAEQSAKAARLERLRRHVHAMQQSTPAPIATAEELAETRKARLTLRQDQRERIAELTALHPQIA